MRRLGSRFSNGCEKKSMKTTGTPADSSCLTCSGEGPRPSVKTATSGFTASAFSSENALAELATCGMRSRSGNFLMNAA